MVLKRSLSAVLAVSMVLSAATAGAQAGPATVGASGTPNDSIDLVLQATLTKSPVEARALLVRAKAKLDTEKLPTDTVVTINQLIAQATAKLTLSGTQNPLGGGAPISFSIDGTPKVTAPQVVAPSAKPATGTPDQYALIARAIELNPDVHTIMREIGIGRIARDSGNLDAILKENTNQSIDQADRSHSTIDAVLGDAGKFIKALRDTGMIKDWSQVNKALKAKHESIPIDILAKQIIDKATQQSAMYGALKQLAAAPNVKLFAGLGVTAEAIATYSLNADLVLRLADLYDMNLTEIQQDVAILTILPVGKVVIFAGKNIGTVKKTTERLSELFAQAKSNPNPSAMARFFTSVFASPLMSGVAKRMGLGQTAAAARAVEVAPAAKPVEAVAGTPEVAPTVKPATAGALSRLEQVVARVESAAAAAEGAAARVEGAVATVGTTAENVAKAPLSWKAQAGWLLAHVLISGVDTYATGRAAMWWFGRQKQKSRDTETADFHAFLMQDKAKGFFKLMVATLNAGSTLPAVYNIKKQKADRRVDFVMNIARSIKICSPEDGDRFNQLKAKGAASNLNAAKNYLDSDYRLLRFECDTNLGYSRYNQIAKEFMTFNAIPEWEVAQLRLASYDERMQMGELLMQAQFLYEEPNDDQSKFFQTTIAKFLGLNRVEDINYFSRLYGFIRQRGGMEQNVSSPTGWGIRLSSVDDPWAQSATYTIPGGPDLPSPPPAGK